ncbi:MAG TPA: enolase C-terminal domain-like protein [Asticcacaulis sp.]|nr:enolase C-terminal domain-like protein [Asticcacaulis sp.]
MRNGVLRAVRAAAYTVPTDAPESDGTAQWSSTTLVVVHVDADGETGMGYTYAAPEAAALIGGKLAEVLQGRRADDIPALHHALSAAVRNMGRSGIAACAISALDHALWDVKAKRLGVSLIRLLGAAREAMPVYGSGGFTSSGPTEIVRDIEGWRAKGIRLFKIKIGRDEGEDRRRVAAAVEALRHGEQLFVDANGAYDARQAVYMAGWLGEMGVRWFEEPVSSDDAAGLAFVRKHAPGGLAVAAGEYAFTPDAFRLLIGAVDVLQADATRCLGLSGFLQADALCEAHHLPLSSHCAPGLHVAPMCHAGRGVHMEYFHDHVRIESMLFEGVPEVMGGRLQAQDARPGHGLCLREDVAREFAA